jgi:hypothetical protein
MSQGVMVKWKTIDDQSGERNQLLKFMKIREKFWKEYLRSLTSHRKDRCVDCEGEDINKPVLG